MLVFAAILVLVSAVHSQKIDLNRVVVTVFSQPEESDLHKQHADETQIQIDDAFSAEGYHNVPVIQSSTVKFHGGWTYFPLMHTLISDYQDEADWFIFVDENTVVDVKVLEQLLRYHEKRNRKGEFLFLGHALKDLDSAITHHFDLPGSVLYPAPVGFILSKPLLKHVFDRFVANYPDGMASFPKDFSIDPLYEFAKTIANYKKDRHVQKIPDRIKGDMTVQHDERFCLELQPAPGKCAFWPRKTQCTINGQNEIRLFASKVLFMVKTFEGNYKKRLKFIQRSWGQAALNIKYISDKADTSYDVETLPYVVNTAKGHCNKTLAIVNYFNEAKEYDWLVITDDDTILSVQKLLEYLICFDPQKIIHIGQRYGFKVSTGQFGYDYITGGGGMIFSRGGIERLLEPPQGCRCPHENDPDDMRLGACMSNQAHPIFHSPRFHQARPDDYPLELLKSQDPISFHGFWNVEDPVKDIYDGWFKEADADLTKFKRIATGKLHEEL